MLGSTCESRGASRKLGLTKNLLFPGEGWLHLCSAGLHTWSPEQIICPGLQQVLVLCAGTLGGALGAHGPVWRYHKALSL